MQSPVLREVALAQAALEHALYFVDLGANEKAAAYFQFAAQRFQNAAKTLILADCSTSLSKVADFQ